MPNFYVIKMISKDIIFEHTQPICVRTYPGLDFIRAVRVQTYIGSDCQIKEDPCLNRTVREKLMVKRS